MNVSFETFSRQTTIPITIEVKYRGTREEGGSPKDGEIEYIVMERQGRHWSGKIKQRRGKKRGEPAVS